MEYNTYGSFPTFGTLGYPDYPDYPAFPNFSKFIKSLTPESPTPEGTSINDENFPQEEAWELIDMGKEGVDTVATVKAEPPTPSSLCSFKSAVTCRNALRILTAVTFIAGVITWGLLKDSPIGAILLMVSYMLFLPSLPPKLV